MNDKATDPNYGPVYMPPPGPGFVQYGPVVHLTVPGARGVQFWLPAHLPTNLPPFQAGVTTPSNVQNLSGWSWMTNTGTLFPLHKLKYR